MKTRKRSLFGWAVVLAALVSQSATAEGHRPSQQTLSEMGLGGLVVLSDAEAMGIRGHGYKSNGSSSAVVAGNSFATFTTPFGTAHSENLYAANGSHFAFGKNSSHAGLEIKTTRGHGHKRGKPWKDMRGKRWRGKPGGHMGGNMGGHMGGHMGGNMGGNMGGHMGGHMGGNMGGNMGGKHHGRGGHHGGGKTITSIRVFAGGHSFAAAR